uniref:Uncharacterized protein n=1 Tax=Populus trichocarpa TaxID=3694 RepID=B9IGR2_POPTR
MEDDHIIADELPVLEDVMARTRIPMETKARDNHTPLSGSQIYLTLPEVITSTTAHFKRRRVFTPIENDVLALIIEVHVVAFPLPRLPVLSVEVATTRTFTWDIFEKADFPAMTEEERQLMKVVVGGRSGLEKVGLKVVRMLKKILTIPSDISMMSNETYNHYLILTSQMTFNVLDRANQAAFEQLKKEKVIVIAELMSLKVAYSSLKEQLNVVYSSLKEQIQSFVLQLSSNDKLLQANYNQVDTLKREILEAKTTQDGLRVELLTFREEA